MADNEAGFQASSGNNAWAEGPGQPVRSADSASLAGAASSAGLADSASDGGKFPAVDLNCDLGESFGVYVLGNDEAMLDLVTSANVACGYHAGDPAVMRRTVRACLVRGVNIGAHPGLPDAQGFGRRKMSVTRDEAYDMTIYQIGALWGFVRAEGGVLRHVKPHGALYNMAAVDERLADGIAEAAARVDESLILVGPPDSELAAAGRRYGLRTAGEGFADRTYTAEGRLTPRSDPRALIADAAAAARQAAEMILHGRVTAVDGRIVPLKAETICLHGDGPNPRAFALALRTELERLGVRIRPL